MVKKTKKKIRKRVKRRVRKIIEEKKKIDKKLELWRASHYRQKRRVMFAFTLLVLLTIYFFKDADFILRAISAIAFVSIFYVADHFFDIRFQKHHYAFIIIIAVASVLLSPLYYIQPQYDKVQHFIQPMFVSSIIFYMISKLDLRLKWRIIFTIFIVISILTIFEMSEYALDKIFDWRLQGVYLRDATGLEKFNLILEPLDDTIYDLMLGILGAGTYGIVAGLYQRKKEKINKK